MISSHDIQAYARHIFARGRGHPDKHIMHPQREWLLIVASFFLLFSAGSVFVWLQYVQFTNVEATVTATESLQIPEYQSERVQAVHDVYQERQAEFERLLGQAPVVPPAATSSEATEGTSTPLEDAATTTTTETATGTTADVRSETEETEADSAAGENTQNEADAAATPPEANMPRPVLE